MFYLYQHKLHDSFVLPSLESNENKKFPDFPPTLRMIAFNEILINVEKCLSCDESALDADFVTNYVDEDKQACILLVLCPKNPELCCDE